MFKYEELRERFFYLGVLSNPGPLRFAPRAVPARELCARLCLCISYIGFNIKIKLYDTAWNLNYFNTFSL